MAAPTTSGPRWRPPRHQDGGPHDTKMAAPRNQDGGPCDAFGGARREEERVRRRGKEDTVRVQGGYSGDTVRVQWGTVRIQ